MLPTNCNFDEPLYITIIHWITASISIPIYGIAFLILLFKCPKHFNEYRNYLLAHIFSGFLLDYHIRIIWKLNVFLPWATLCSNSFAADYAVHSFQIFVVILLSVGWTGVYLFIYRMKAATKHEVGHPTVQNTVIYLYYAFYAVSGVVMVFLVLIYEELRDQKEYKVVLEQKLGPLPQFMWCESCFSMRFDTWRFLTFYVFGYLSLMLAFASGLLAAFEAYRSLNSKNLRLSAKTASIQKNFLYSLVMVVIIHIVFFLFPLCLHFTAHFIVVDNQYITPFAVMMLQDHGTITTFTIVITNNLLRRATKNLFNCRRTDQQTILETNNANSGMAVLTVN